MNFFQKIWPILRYILCSQCIIESFINQNSIYNSIKSKKIMHRFMKNLRNFCSPLKKNAKNEIHAKMTILRYLGFGCQKPKTKTIIAKNTPNIPIPKSQIFVSTLLPTIYDVTVPYSILYDCVLPYFCVLP